MFIHQIRIKNYLIHQDTSVDLTPLTVFVGPSGAGKSAFFDALLNFSMLARGNLRQAFGPWPWSFKAAMYRPASVSKVSRIGYNVRLSREANDPEFLDYEIDYAQNGVDDNQATFTIYNETIRKGPTSELIFDRANPDAYSISQQLDLEPDRAVFSAIRKQFTSNNSTKVQDDLILYCAQQISRFSKYRLDAWTLALPSRLPDVASDVANSLPVRLGFRGEDLAAVLYYLSETRSRDLELIQENIRRIDSKFGRFEFNTVGTDRVGMSIVFNDARGVVSAARLSSGQLIYVGLMVLIQTRPAPVLIIEEAENGLAPQAVRKFYEAVRNLAYAESVKDRSQVLLSSQSPLIITQAWNGQDREFIHQVKISEGKALVRKFSEAVRQSGIHLRNEDRSGGALGLSNAEELMSGYLM